MVAHSPLQDAQLFILPMVAISNMCLYMLGWRAYFPRGCSIKNASGVKVNRNPEANRRLAAGGRLGSVLVCLCASDVLKRLVST